MPVIIKCALSLLFLVGTSLTSAEELAEDLYTDYKEVLYQIKIIDLESGQKSTIGSGFVIEQNGLSVTNYHVVSDYILKPEQFRIEVEDIQGQTNNAKLVNFDVINDLALLQIERQTPHEKFLPLAKSLPIQGSTIYSLGNPHDLGMIVVPGTYNGLKKNSFHDVIHFTGSVNSGMSGGPVVNENGQVMGVNVASAGNQLGFLVPLDKLQALVNQKDSLDVTQYKQNISKQLTRNQIELIAQLTEQQWPKAALGDAFVPDAMADFITCWGGSNADDDEAQYLSARKSCSLDHNIYINNEMRSGRVAVRFEWLSSNKLNNIRFYNLVDGRMRMLSYQDGSSKEDFSEHQCQQDLVENMHKVKMKSVVCIKAYKDYDALFDVMFVSATLDKTQASLISRFYLSGISKASFERFMPTFMDAISWQ